MDKVQFVAGKYMQMSAVLHVSVDRFMQHCVISHARVCNRRMSVVHSAFFNENAHITTKYIHTPTFSTHTCYVIDEYESDI